MTAMLRSAPATRFAPPEDVTATEPPEQRGLRRDGVRLLVAAGGTLRHTRFARIGEHLRAGDVLVVNTSATVPGQLDGHRAGRPIVVHVANRLADGTRVVELRTSPDAAEPVLDGVLGEQIGLSGGARLELLTPYPHPESSPTGRWQSALAWPDPAVRTTVGLSGRARSTDQLRVSARPVSDQRVPDHLRALPGQR